MIDADNNTYRAGGGLLFKDTYPRVEYNSFIENGFYENEPKKNYKIVSTQKIKHTKCKISMKIGSV